MVEKRSTSHGCMAQEPTSLQQDSCPSCKRMTDKHCMPRRISHAGSIVPRNCVLPPAHIGLDLVYSGITVFPHFWGDFRPEGSWGALKGKTTRKPRLCPHPGPETPMMATSSSCKALPFTPKASQYKLLPLG